jgi:hypothetical protein
MRASAQAMLASDCGQAAGSPCSTAAQKPAIHSGLGCSLRMASAQMVLLRPWLLKAPQLPWLRT